MQVIFSEEFRKDYKKIKDRTLRLRIVKNLNKLANLPKSEKPLKYDLKSYRSIRIPPFRIIYRLEKNKIIINVLDHRKDIYK